jgi:hypothetical protein
MAKKNHSTIDMQFLLIYLYTLNIYIFIGIILQLIFNNYEKNRHNFACFHAFGLNN